MEGQRSLLGPINANGLFIVKEFFLVLLYTLCCWTKNKVNGIFFIIVTNFHACRVDSMSMLLWKSIKLTTVFLTLCDWCTVIINALSMVSGDLLWSVLMFNVNKSEFNWTSYVLWFIYGHSHMWKQYTLKARLDRSQDRIVNLACFEAHAS